MPSSLVVVALVLAWLVVLVPMIVRKRQEVARTADSELAARVLRSGSEAPDTDEEPEADEFTGDFADEADEEAHEGRDVVRDGSVRENGVDDAPEDAAHDADGDDMTARYYDEADLEYARHYRQGRGGFDPEAAAIIARARYAFRQRVVLAMLVGAVVTAVVAAVAFPWLWWAHGAIDVVLVSYLVYLRRQVRIETEIRERRLARLQRVRRAQAAARARAEAAEPVYERQGYDQGYGPVYEPEYAEPEHEAVAEDPYEDYDPERDRGPRERVADGPAAPRVTRAGAVLVDVDDEDPAFAELDVPGSSPYRRAVGE